MKTKTFFTTIICFILILANAQTVSAQETKKEKNDKETIELLVPDMHCQNCQKKIEKNIAYEKGVTDLKVDLENKTVTVTFKKKNTNKEKIQAAFEKLGYSSEIVEKKE